MNTVPSNKPKTDTVIEHALQIANGDGTVQGVFSHREQALVEHERNRLVIDAAKEGRTPPEYQIVKRACTYPLDSKGRRQAEGSSCVETLL